MQAVLLCAGKSTRIAPLVDKVLLKIAGKTVLEHQIENLTKIGLRDFVIVANAENLLTIQNLCQKLQTKVSRFQFTIQEDFNLGIYGALKKASPLVEEDCLVINSNDFVENSLYEDLFKISQSKAYKAIVCGKVVHKYFPGGYISLDSHHCFKDVVEKPGEGNEPSNLVNILIHYIQNLAELVEIGENCEIPKNNNDIYQSCLQIIAQDSPILVHAYNGFWQAIKYPWHILHIQSYLLKKLDHFIHPQAEISPHAIIRGKVYIEEGVKVLENAIIVGPCFIGKNSVIANHTLIRESNIGERCVIGFSTEITRSWLEKDIWTHFNYIGDSLIGEKVTFGAGAIIGNLRFDEQNIHTHIKGEKVNTQIKKLGAMIGSETRIGINATINPGIKIGKKCFIGGGVAIQKDIPDNSLVYHDFQPIIKENKNTFTPSENDLNI
ncbi:MAG TPA: sugar phosphate nucleotidyltransferase [Candidatus Gracilibacteria bacterium]|nr:sugar phosphate nucleotidyltransferase [Candidatus Gracilibacteria bacterium]